MSGEELVPHIFIFPCPEGLPRMESGPVQFGDDWPGVFIRGDHALSIGMMCIAVANIIAAGGRPDELQLHGLKGVGEFLKSCEKRLPTHPPSEHMNKGK